MKHVIIINENYIGFLVGGGEEWSYVTGKLVSPRRAHQCHKTISGD